MKRRCTYYIPSMAGLVFGTPPVKCFLNFVSFLGPSPSQLLPQSIGAPQHQKSHPARPKHQHLNHVPCSARLGKMWNIDSDTIIIQRCINDCW